ncbi:short-chain dehydrogenase reductase family [Cordyceps militaris]|uniref:Short-chain dehydrogenase reductase family n=1 Tax=Cordyceps militaris TaxID=73501 RepID=A0A2H4S7V0_CORMI|nr:short-chain dehydrogenase reductase family [Cordyceps militaris]
MIIANRHLAPALSHILIRKKDDTRPTSCTVTEALIPVSRLDQKPDAMAAGGNVPILQFRSRVLRKFPFRTWT